MLSQVQLPSSRAKAHSPEAEGPPHLFLRCRTPDRLPPLVIPSRSIPHPGSNAKESAFRKFPNNIIRFNPQVTILLLTEVIASEVTGHVEAQKKANTQRECFCGAGFRSINIRLHPPRKITKL